MLLNLHKTTLVLLLTLSTMLASPNVAAEQQNFSIKNSGSSTEFSYQWKHNKQTYNLNYAIANQSLYSMPDSPSTYSSVLLEEFVYRNVVQEAKLIDPTLAKINVTRKNDGLSFNVKSRDKSDAQQILTRLKKAHLSAQDDYWSEHMFVQYTANMGQTGIRHDHSRYTNLSAKSLTPIVDAIKAMQQQANNPREFLTIALSWVQSIPYNTLESRLSSNGAGFVSPRDLMMQNQGDCDSKSTLLAAILKAYNPHIDVQMVYLPNHALLGVGMRKLPKEMTVNQKGIDYVLLEPTGPAQFNIGEVADTTKLALRNRQFDMVRL